MHDVFFKVICRTKKQRGVRFSCFICSARSTQW